MIIAMESEKDTERRERYARAIWEAMIDDEPPAKDDLFEFGGYLDAAAAVIELADAEIDEIARC